jgi:hypothetical protein
MAILAFYVGVFFLAVGLVALFKGSVRSFRVGSRRQAVVLIVVALVGTGIAAANSPAPPADQQAIVKEPTSKPKRTFRPSPRPSVLPKSSKAGLSPSPNRVPKSPTPTLSLTPSPTKKTPSNRSTHPVASPSPTLKPRSAPPPTPVLLSHTIYRRGNANFGATKRLVLEVEVKQWPVSATALSQLAKSLILKEKGKGWHAVSIAFRYDRREALPAFGVYEWAPGGDWGNAGEGNPRTWKGYRTVKRLQPKLGGDPADCSPPSEEAYVVAADFNAALERGEGDDEDALLRRIGGKYGKSQAETFDLVYGVDLWSYC